MGWQSRLQLSAGIIKRAQSHRGILAGIASLEALASSPSAAAVAAVEWRDGAAYESAGKTPWPASAVSVLMLAKGHPRSLPEQDWWDGKGTAGNRDLIAVSKKLQAWFESTLETTAVPLPYHVENGGVFLKDAAVLAGLGVIGKNNLLITPELGPRIRLRALLLDLDLAPTGPIDWFAPCTQCPRPCQHACPQAAFENGAYIRDRCMAQMEADRALGAITDPGGQRIPGAMVKYCRACELACPVGEWDT
jgi:epoxyqueuosine reductase